MRTQPQAPQGNLKLKQHQRNHSREFCTCISISPEPKLQASLWGTQLWWPCVCHHFFAISRPLGVGGQSWGSEGRKEGFYLGALGGPSGLLAQRGRQHPGQQPGSRARVWSRVESGQGHNSVPPIDGALTKLSKCRTPRSRGSVVRTHRGARGGQDLGSLWAIPYPGLRLPVKAGQRQPPQPVNLPWIQNLEVWTPILLLH